MINQLIKNNRVLLLLFAFTLGILTNNAIAKDHFEMAEKSIARLNAASQKDYNDGLEALDHIDYEGAIEHFEKVRSSNPEHAEIRILLGDLYKNRASREQGTQAIAYNQQAFNVYQEVLNINGTPVAVNNLEKATEGIRQTEASISGQAERDASLSRVSDEYLTSLKNEQKTRRRNLKKSNGKSDANPTGRIRTTRKASNSRGVLKKSGNRRTTNTTGATKKTRRGNNSKTSSNVRRR